MIFKRLVLSTVTVVAGLIAAPGFAQESPLVRLLKSGKLPAERVESVVELACRQAGPADLQFIFEKALDAQAWSLKARQKALASLSEAAQARQAQPDGDRSAITRLLTAETPRELQLPAVRLAAVWKEAAAADAFARLAVDARGSEELRFAALEGLLAVGGAGAQQTLQKLASAEHALAIRYRAVAALAGLDLSSAAVHAAAALVDATPQEMPTEMLDGFLQRKGGADALSAAIAQAPLNRDQAKLALRTMYAVGQNDPALSKVLSEMAGVAADVPKPTPDDIKRLTAEAVAHGDPARGERIFRRTDSTCLRCHSLVKAGGQVGPDLSALGVSSPVEYVVTSILDPSAAMKETYVTRTILTSDGEILNGIVVERNDQTVKLKDAKGKITTIATSDIEDEENGKSLMPEGVTKFLTHEELLDLVRFVAELGKAGEFGPRPTPSIQRWRLLKNPPAELLETSAAALEQIRTLLAEAPESSFVPAYAQVNGRLPLAEVSPTPGRPSVLFLRGEIDVTAAGRITFRRTSTAPVLSWLDGSPYDAQAEFSAELPEGRHVLTLRVEASGEAEETLLQEVLVADGSTATFTVVGGE